MFGRRGHPSGRAAYLTTAHPQEAPMNGRRIAVGLVALAAGAGLVGAAAPAASAASTGTSASASLCPG